MKENHYENIALLKGFTGEEQKEAFSEMRARERSYKKEEYILRAGQTTSRMGVVLKGSVTIEVDDALGNRTILSHIAPFGLFAETYAWLGEEVMLVDVRANEDCRILFLDTAVIKKELAPNKKWQYKLIKNYLTISARKNLALSVRSFHTAPYMIRGRVLSYLNSISLQKKQTEFDIPFDRQQLADYLNVERTALSKELGKMKREHIIDFRRNHFNLLQPDS